MRFWEHEGAGERLYYELLGAICRKFEITKTELDILLFLAHYPAHDTATQIVQYRHLSKSNVSVSLRELQKRGWVQAEYRDNNRKTLHLSLCPTSKRVVEAGQEAQREFFSILFDGFSEKEKADLFRSLEKLADNVHTHLAAVDEEQTEPHDANHAERKS